MKRGISYYPILHWLKLVVFLFFNRKLRQCQAFQALKSFMKYDNDFAHLALISLRPSNLTVKYLMEKYLTLFLISFPWSRCTSVSVLCHLEILLRNSGNGAIAVFSGFEVSFLGGFHFLPNFWKVLYQSIQFSLCILSGRSRGKKSSQNLIAEWLA